MSSLGAYTLRSQFTCIAWTYRAEKLFLKLLYVFNMRNKVIYIQDGIREVNEETITIFGSQLLLNGRSTDIFNVLLVYLPGYAGKGRRGELRGIYSEAFYPGFCNVSCMQAKCANE